MLDAYASLTGSNCTSSKCCKANYWACKFKQKNLRISIS